MTGAKLPIADTSEAVAAALASRRPLLIVGEQALLAKPDLRASLAAVIKKHPYLRTDGIVLRREANRSISPAMVTRRIISPPPNCFVAGGCGGSCPAISASARRKNAS